MNLISFICFILFIFILFAGFRKGNDFFAPGRIFLLVWTFSIGLMELKLSRLQFAWDLVGWIVFLLGLLALLLGVYISFVNNANKKFITLDEIRKSIREQGLNEELAYQLIIILFVIYIIAFLAEYLILGYLPIFTSNPDKARTMFGVFGIHLIVTSVNAIFFLIAEYIILAKTSKHKKSLLIFLSIILLGSFLLLLQRYNFFILGTMILCLMYYSGRQIRFRTIFIAVAVIAGFLILVKNLRLGQLAEFYFYTTLEMKIPYKYAIISEPYMYITMNLENFVRNFPRIDHHVYGLFTFDFLTAFIGIKHWLGDYFNTTKFPHYIANFNTFPFYWVYYYDFGFFGLAFFPFLIGFLISEFYYMLHRNPSLIYLALYSIGFSVIVVSYSSDPLTRLDMVVNYVLIVIFQVFISKKVAQSSNE